MIGETVFYQGKPYYVVSAETCDRWWIMNNEMDEPILVEESEIERWN